MKPHATHTDAVASWPCPASRLFAAPQPNCRGCYCPLWRWTSGTPFLAAVKAKALEIGEKTGAKPEAAALVSADPVGNNLHGYCGLGGEV